MNIFFDVDYTILAMDGSLRPKTREVFEQLVEDGHTIYIWSGVGLRTTEIQKHELEEYVSGIYQKPLEDFELGLKQFGVPVRPDFVIDDYPQIVNAFGGMVVRPYYFRAAEDTEMQEIYRIITEFAQNGHSDDIAFRPASKNSLNPGN